MQKHEYGIVIPERFFIFKQKKHTYNVLFIFFCDGVYKVFSLRCDGLPGRVCLSWSPGFVQRCKFALKTVLSPQGN